jgi:DNA-3-methyladenine glycosylase
VIRRAGRAFFRGDTRDVARRLLGAWLVHETAGERLVGRIVEVEAYLGRVDPASHSYGGATDRNASMFLGPGHAYVYRIYGMHHCFNVVTAGRGVGEAVLVRALEPIEGIEAMARRRGRERVNELCKGPGRLTVAMGIGPDHDGSDLVSGPLHVALDRRARSGLHIAESPRVGITKAAGLLLRYSLAGSPWVSRR